MFSSDTYRPWRPPPYQIRPARDSDGHQLIRLIGAVFAEYPGCVMDVDGELPELRNIAQSFASWNGEFWVAERAGRIIGCVGYTRNPIRARQPRGIELKKLYVERCERQQGIARELLRRVEDAGAAGGVDYIELWSDTRFLDAHRFYERKGYQRSEQTRELFDQSDTVEFHFRKER